jgi:hypothetical protein
VNGGDGALSVHRVTAGAMAERAVALLHERLQAGARPADLAVLSRVNSALLPVQVALTEAGVGHTAPLDTSVLKRTGVRTTLAYLRLGLDPERIRREDVLETINRPARKVRSAVQPLLARSNRWSLAQFERLADALDPSHRERFEGYLDDLHTLAYTVAQGADTATLLAVVRDRIGLGEAMDALDSSRTRPEGSSHGDDLDALAQLAALHPDPATYAGWLTDRLRVPADPAGVVLSTVHRVKGMEWDHVVVFAANAGLFPHRLADEAEEERRVFHVAITRCRRSVAIVADQERTSPFVAELRRAAPTEEDGPAGVPAGASAGVGPAGVAAGAGPAGASAGTGSAAGDVATVPGDVAPRSRPDGGVVADPGLPVVLAGGLAGRVLRATRDGAEVVVDDEGVAVRVWVPHGQPVTVAGRRTTLGPAPRTTARPGAARLLDVGGAEPDAALFEALRAWRADVAARAGVPAYLVFHDRHLQVIAGRKPRNLRELAACPGVGPAKLERYADDLLDLVSAH